MAGTPKRSLNTTPRKQQQQQASSQSAAESSVQRATRALLSEHAAARAEFAAVIQRSLVPRLRHVLELYAEIETTVQFIERTNGCTNLDDEHTPDGSSSTNTGHDDDFDRAGPSAPASSGPGGTVEVQLTGPPLKLAYVAAQTTKLATAVSQARAALVSLDRTVERLRTAARKLEDLVERASSGSRSHHDAHDALAGGIDAFFSKALWVSWPLSRFSDALYDITAPYGRAHTLVTRLTARLLVLPSLYRGSGAAAAGQASEGQSGDGGGGGKRRGDESTKTASEGKARQQQQSKLSGQDAQACMSLIAAQPFIVLADDNSYALASTQDANGDVPQPSPSSSALALAAASQLSPELFDEICSVEVPPPPPA